MSVRYRVPALICAASAAALLLGGCGSSGTVSSIKGGGTSGGTSTTGGSSTGGNNPTPSAGDTTSPAASTGGALAGLGSLSTDPGCKEALTALSDLTALQSDPTKALTQFPATIAKIRDGANTTQRPGAKDAINKMADDFQGVLDGLSKGQTPDQTKLQADGEAVGLACAG
jgi:hypothetical protein